MSLAKSSAPSVGPIRGAARVIKESLKTAQRHPQIFLYPYIALFFTSITYSLVSATLLPGWYNRIFHTAAYVTPHKFAAILGIVGFSAFYTALVAAYFTSAVAASILAILEDRQVSPWYGLEQVGRNFLRITGFALLAVFFFPIGIIVQRRKLPAGWFGVLGSSLTLHMAQVAPAIFGTHDKFGATVRDSIDTLGKRWREGLVLKVGMYLTIFVFFVLPKIVQHHWFKSKAAIEVSWLISIELAASSYVTFKVVNSIFTAVLYHQAKQNNT